jgi:hypothetical protein
MKSSKFNPVKRRPLRKFLVIHKLLTILTRDFTPTGFINIMNKIAFLLPFRRQLVPPQYHQGWPSSTFLLWITQLSTLPILILVGWVAAFSLNKRPSNINNSIHPSKLNNYIWHFLTLHLQKINICSKPMAVISPMLWPKDYRTSSTLLH